MKTLKNWWLQIATIIIAIADLGFDVFTPLIVKFEISEKWVTVFKVAFAIYAIIKSKNQLPTQNIGKLQDIVYEKSKE